MPKKLAGKVAIVTGASKGIGASVAIHLAAEGASVVVNYARDKEGANHTVNEITKNGGKAIAIQADETKPADITRLFAESAKVLGKIDILINNAGIYEFAPIEEVTPEHFHRQFELNVLGLLLASKEAVKYFGKSGGTIVNISSTVSTAHLPNSAVYAGTKGAVDAITRCLSVELGPRKIRVNAVNPGLVETEGTKNTDPEFKKYYLSQTPLGRTGLPQDIGPAVVFLASDESSWMTGECLFITGGFR